MIASSYLAAERELLKSATVLRGELDPGNR